MKLMTLIEHHNQLEKAEVEIELIPGIPQIHFLGLPDKSIRESFFRIKSAFKSCGYKFPQSQQIIVNIKPSHLKKSSKGLELAVALGLLVKTQQREISDDVLKSLIYGELELDGHVLEPQDLKKYLTKDPFEQVLTGKSESKTQTKFFIEKLDQDIQQNEVNSQDFDFIRPDIGLNENYSAEEAELLFLMSATGLHTLLAGPSGFGKSTLAKNYYSFLKEPDLKDFCFLQKNWPPLVSPHHSVTPAAFLGGGAQLYKGELERAQSGVLFLDELLEFNTIILEALRGPMTGEKLRLARQGELREFDCRFQVVATTNLCPCGKWVPLQLPNCRFSRSKCEAYLNRLSGPLTDRFGLLYFYPSQKLPRTVSGDSILSRLGQYQHSFKALEQTGDYSEQNLASVLYPEASQRRLNALNAVARVYATENGRSIIELSDLKKAEKWTIRPFIDLEKGIS